jgi:hypothetical protein
MPSATAQIVFSTFSSFDAHSPTPTVGLQAVSSRSHNSTIQRQQLGTMIGEIRSSWTAAVLLQP